MSQNDAVSAGYPPGALEHLAQADAVLADLIARYGVVERERNRPPLYALMSAIVGQQISVKAAAAIMGRLLALLPAGQQVNADALADVPFEQLRAVGLSACPADAMPELMCIADYVCHLPGGYGAFREFAELIIRTQTSGSVRAHTAQNGHPIQFNS